jgi:murein DD-endopeptidase MepM/ murein hydrolase activator NlpD
MKPQHLIGGTLARRRLVRIAVVTAVAVSLIPVGSVAATNSSLTSEQVATEIIRVQDKADRLAQRVADAEQRSGELDTELATAQDTLTATTAQYSQIEAGLAQIAINRFTGASNITMLVVFGNPTDEIQTNVLRNVALNQGGADLDQVDAVLGDLNKDRQRVSALQAENNQVAQELIASQADVEQQLSQLATLRQQLNDQEVKRAYEAKLAAKRSELAARQAEAAAAATAAPVQVRGGGTPPSAPSSTDPSSPPPQTTAAAPKTAPKQAPAPAAQPAPKQALAPTTDPAPAPDPSPDPSSTPIVNPGFLCPIAGPSAFVDTWGAPRSGGRKHQGVDMMSPEGTPLVAVVAGDANMHTSSLGGNVISLSGADGNGYFYGHLSAFEGSSRSVSAGEVIGYVGHTGDTTANHLHFEIHPGRGPAVDPTPTVRQYC